MIFIMGFMTAGEPDTVAIGEVDFVRQKLKVGAGASAVAAGDLNGDGHTDLVIASALSDDIIIFRGNGDGRMRSLGRIPAGKNPVDVALADINGDGIIDAVLANHETLYLTLLLGTGDGTLREAGNSPLGVGVLPHPHAIRAEDMDGDGNPDLVVDHREGKGVLIVRGHGDGSFESTGRLVPAGGDPYRGMALGDINSDGRPDLITPNPGEAGVVLSTGAEYRLGEAVPDVAPFAVELGDFNADGKLDLVAASDEGSPLVSLFHGNGRGGFSEAEGSPAELAPGGKKIAVGDFNGDGIDDAVVCSYLPSDVLVLLGDADAFRTVFLPGGTNLWGAAAADLNEDGVDDLILIDESVEEAVIYLSTGW